MARRNIFIEVFTVEDILDGKLHGEILVELVVCIEVQEEVRIACLEAAALLPRFRAIRDEHAVDIHRPWIVVEGGAEMEQVTRDIIVLLSINLARLPGVIDVGGPAVAVLLVHCDLEAVRLGFPDIHIFLFRLCRIQCDQLDRIFGLRVERIRMDITLMSDFFFTPNSQ